MSLTFPTDIKNEMTKMSANNAFLLLFEIDIEGDQTYYLCANNENITFDGNLYIAWSIDLDDITYDSSGKISVFSAKVDNTTRTLQYVIDGYNGLSDSNITIKIVNSDHLSTAIPDFDGYYKIKSVKCNEQIIDFELGSEDILRKRVPYRTYNKNRCPYLYKGIECGSVSSIATCNHTLSDCRSRDNLERFGGEINIPDRTGVYI